VSLKSVVEGSLSWWRTAGALVGSSALRWRCIRRRARAGTGQYQAGRKAQSLELSCTAASPACTPLFFGDLDLYRLQGQSSTTRD
jgi:hypothetical protein